MARASWPTINIVADDAFYFVTVTVILEFAVHKHPVRLLFMWLHNAPCCKRCVEVAD